MIRSVLVLALITAACSSTDTSSGSHNTPQPIETVRTPVVFADFTINGATLRLVDRSGRCTLLYKTRSAQSSDEQSLDVGMSTPCNFVRIGNASDKPQHYFYRQGSDRRAVLLITGGPPSTEFPVRDAFMPEGCGTWLAKLRVFNHKVELEFSGDNGPPKCPSSPADEMMFAA